MIKHAVDMYSITPKRNYCDAPRSSDGRIASQGVLGNVEFFVGLEIGGMTGHRLWPSQEGHNLSQPPRGNRACLASMTILRFNTRPPWFPQMIRRSTNIRSTGWRRLLG